MEPKMLSLECQDNTLSETVGETIIGNHNPEHMVYVWKIFHKDTTGPIVSLAVI